MKCKIVVVLLYSTILIYFGSYTLIPNPCVFKNKLQNLFLFSKSFNHIEYKQQLSSCGNLHLSPKSFTEDK